MRGKLYLGIARIHLAVAVAGFALTVSARFHDAGWVWPPGLALIVAGLLASFVRPKPPDRAPVEVRSPVVGRWVPVNSPADKVPSHGTHELGQTYAIDLVYHPAEAGPWRPVKSWPPAGRPESFPAFGRPIHAPADGVVVKATGWQRDHWSRNSWAGLAYALVEMFGRQALSWLTLSAGRFILGNHVVLDLGDGVYAVFAHFKRGSVRVRKGQRVRAGERLADCGNSGNSSEPHLHFHLMDRPRASIGAGIPFAFDYETSGAPRSGVPASRKPFTVPA